MGKHMMQCAALVDVDNPRLKLMLMCFAESARDTDRIAFPGYDQLLKWTSVKRAQLHNLINRAIELQLIERTQRPSRYRRAEYRLFPNGCCELHGKRPAMVVDDGGDVVAIGSNRLSTGNAEHAQPVDPKTGPMPPPDGVYGSNPRPLCVQSPNGETTLSVKHSNNTPDTGTTPAQLTDRARDDVVDTMDFSVDRPLAGRQRQPTGFALGCRHCDGGFVCDGDGLPLSKCPHCHPAHRTNGATA